MGWKWFALLNFSSSPGLCAYPCLWLWEGLQWLEAFVVWSASAILLLGEKTYIYIYIMWFWIVPRLWHDQGCYLKDIACRNKVEVIPEGWRAQDWCWTQRWHLLIWVKVTDDLVIQWYGSKTPLTFNSQSCMQHKFKHIDFWKSLLYMLMVVSSSSQHRRCRSGSITMSSPEWNPLLFQSVSPSQLDRHEWWLAWYLGVTGGFRWVYAYLMFI